VRLRPVATRAVLWDLDGVLVDSYEVWFALLGASARALGGREVTRAAFEAGWGQGISADVERWFPERTIPELEAHYHAHFMDHVAHLRVDPDAGGVVGELRRRGLAQALITNTPAPLAHAILAHAGLELDAVVGGTDVPHAKPAPDIVLEACRRLGVAPANALVVGDSRFDRDAARAANVHFVGLRTEGDARVERLADLLTPLSPLPE
jgi:phosphoglycolate phosphatase/AHBA synthesis associated protein